MPAKDEISYFRLLIVHPPFLKEHALETKGKKMLLYSENPSLEKNYLRSITYAAN